MSDPQPTATLLCECGRTIEIPFQSAGKLIPCECGREIEAPSLSSLQTAVAEGNAIAAAKPVRRVATRVAQGPQRFCTFVYGVGSLSGRVCQVGLRSYLTAVLESLETLRGGEDWEVNLQVDIVLLTSGETLIELQPADSDPSVGAAIGGAVQSLASPRVATSVAFSVRRMNPNSYHAPGAWAPPFPAARRGPHAVAIEAALADHGPGEADGLRAASDRSFVALWKRLRGAFVRGRHECEVAAAFDQAYDGSDPEHWMTILDGHLQERPDCAAALERRGGLWVNLGQYDAALKDLADAARLDPKLSSEMRFRSGVIHWRRNQYEKARVEFDAALADRSNHTDALVYRSKLHAEMRSWEAAKSDISRAITADPMSSPIRLEAARVFHHSGDNASAFVHLNEAAALNPREVEAFVMRGFLWSMGDAEDQSLAFDDFNVAIGLNGALPFGYYHRARLHRHRGELLDALQDCDRAVAADPDITDAYTLRSEIRCRLGDHQGAYRDADRALKQQPSANALACRGTISYYLGELDAAMEDFAAALEESPSNPVAFRGRGMAHAQRGEHDDALADFSRAIRHAPGWSSPYLDRANIYRAIKEHDNALADYSRAIKLEPDDAEPYCLRGSLHAEIGDSLAAMRDLTAAITLDASHAAPFHQRGRCALASGDWESALGDLDRAIALGAPLDAHLLRAQARLQAKDPRGAAADYTICLRDYPDLATARLGRAMAWIALGHRTDAEGDLQEAIRLGPEHAAEFETQLLAFASHQAVLGERFEEGLRLANEALDLLPNSYSGLGARAYAKWMQWELVDALADYSRLVELDEDSVATLQNRGQVYAEIGEADAALADLQRAYQLILSKHHAPQALAYILSGRGLAYTLLGRFDEASEDFGRSIELCPDNPWVHYRLGLLHNQLGDRRAAALCLRLSLHLEEPQVPPVYRRRAAAYLKEWGHIIEP